MHKIKLPKVPMPFTPMRRLVHDVLKPSVAIGKRLRGDFEDEENQSPSVEYSKVEGSYILSHTKGRNCVALQNEDAEEDAVVITALNVVPFCCHADLLLMDRAQLIEVANNLNSKLPLAMLIDTSAGRSDGFIRHSIELLVGIRHVVPGAPKPNRSLSLSVSNLSFNDESRVSSVLPLSPVSPLATRKRQAAAVPEHVASPPLVSLREESEDTSNILSELSPRGRPQKRRRISDERDSSPEASPTPVRTRTSCRPRGRILRTQSHRTAGVQPKHLSDAATRRDGGVLRSRSERLPPLKLRGVHRNITVTRGRKAASTRLEESAAVITSTPRSRMTALPGSISTDLDTSISYLQAACADVGPVNSVSQATVSTAIGCSSSNSLSSTPRLERVGVWLTRHAGVDESQDTREVTSEMENLTIHSSVSSDMDISL